MHCHAGAALSILIFGLLRSGAAQDVSHWEYTNVPGFFLQDELDTDALTFDYVRNPITMSLPTYTTDSQNRRKQT
jgi:hypothetical protein